MRRLALVLVVFALVSAPMITAIWTLIVPKYQARGEIRVRPIIPRLVFQTEGNGIIPLYESFVNTQVSLIRGPIVLQRVLDQQEIRGTQWYRNPSQSLMQRLRKDTIPPLERLGDGLSVRPRPQTEIVDVSFTDRDAKDARLIVDAVLDQYIRYVAQKSDDTEDMLSRQLMDQYKMLEREIQGREKICAELQKSMGTEAPQDLISARRIRLDETQARLSELRGRIALLDSQMKQAAGTSGGDSPDREMKRKPKYHEDAEWRKLDISARTIGHNIAADRRDPNDPAAIRAHKDLEFAEELLHLREAQLDEQWNDQVADADGSGNQGKPVSVEHQLAEAQREEGLLRAEVTTQEAEFKRLFEGAQSLAKENSILQQKRKLFDAVRQRLDEKNVERNVPGPIEVLAKAEVPAEFHNDHRVVFTAVALALGLCAAGGAALITRKTK